MSEVDTSAEAVEPDRYDAGLLGATGGGDVAWWHDYVRAELDRAHEHYAMQYAQPLAEADRLLAAIGYVHEEINDDRVAYPEAADDPVSFARRLRVERDEARARAERAEAERDAAQREAEQWQADRNRWHKHAREAENDREALARAIVGETGASAILNAKRVIRERDAARAEAARLREAVTLAANRLDRLSLEQPAGSERRYEVCEWADQARAALAAKEPGHG